MPDFPDQDATLKDPITLAPPSTTTLLPVIYDENPLDKKPTTLATSIGIPNLSNPPPLPAATCPSSATMPPALTQLIRTPLPFNAPTPALTTPNAACAAIVKPGPTLAPPEAGGEGGDVTTMILP
jgi:hypothetical protein